MESPVDKRRMSKSYENKQMVETIWESLSPRNGMKDCKEMEVGAICHQELQKLHQNQTMRRMKTDILNENPYMGQFTNLHLQLAEFENSEYIFSKWNSQWFFSNTLACISCIKSRFLVWKSLSRFWVELFEKLETW